MSPVIKQYSVGTEEVPRRWLREPSAAEPVEPGDPTIRTDAVYVVFTTVEETLRAIRVAHDFAHALSLPVTVVHLRTVPYTLPVEQPTGVSPIETEAFVERLEAEGLNVRLRVFLCRDEHHGVPGAFAPHSLVVVGGRHSWWPTRSARMRRMLEAAGHFVVFVDVSGQTAGRAGDARHTHLTREASHA